jgi:hypothetical protein
MKKALSVTVVLVFTVILLAASLSCSSGAITAALGDKFILPVGQTVDIGGEDLDIEFVQVNTDSRCPTGIECFAAGVAECEMLIIFGQSTSSILFKQSDGEEAMEVFNKYIFRYKLLPYPRAGEKIDPTEYQLEMTVTD